MTDPGFVQHFDAIVSSRKNHPAVEVGTARSVTYGELQERSHEIAHDLEDNLAERVAPDSIVALQVAKSPEFLAAVIGTWRAGCAWVPLDPSLPTSRKEFILADSGAVLSLSLDGLTELPGTTMAEGDRERLAYIIYTSGTTGTPRGVEVTHAGIVNLLDAQVDTFAISASSRCLWFYPSSFDASISEWGTALYRGATLVIEPDVAELSGHELMHRLRQRGVTHADVPPALLGVLPAPEPGGSLETVIVGGAVTSAEAVQRWSPVVRLANVYGPTEATVCTSVEVCADDHVEGSIGHPIANVEYRLVDTNLDDVTDGQAGELLIAGPCLAKGYRNQPELTKQKFIELEGTRYYRTGDSVFQDDRGNWIFRGRIDRQMSVHGVRVEPEEIESVISGVDGVAVSAVLMRKLDEGSKQERLVAFVETTSAVDYSAIDSAIKAELNAHLEQSKHPQVLRLMSSMPRTDSGKPDLSTLRTMPFETTMPPHLGPVGEASIDTELIKLVEICREVTGEPSIGPDSALADFGADSLDAIRLSTLAAEAGFDIPMWLAAQNTTPRVLWSFYNKTLVDGTEAQGYRCSANTLREDATGLVPVVSETDQQSTTAETIFVTGATGFLGCRVVAELLARTDLVVTCLVRGRNGDARLRRHLANEEITLGPDDFSRLRVVHGDVTRPHLGLDSGVFQRLGSEAAAVVHCAAAVNAIASYRELRDTNVVGVANALELAAVAGVPFHHASTLSVFVGTDNHRGTHSENSGLDASVAFGGYNQSKLAAEFLLDTADLPVAVHRHRLGLLAGDSRTGRFPNDDILTMFVRGLREVGMVPIIDRTLRFDMTPCDYAASAMAALVAQSIENPERVNRTWHIAGPETVTHERLIDSLRQHFPIDSVPTSEFVQATVSSTASAGHWISDRHWVRDIAALRMSFLRWIDDAHADDHRPLDLFQSTETVFDSRQSEAVISGLGVTCPTLTDAQIDAMLVRVATEANPNHE